jgi:NAD-dependent SIR2 family protein deacetylase
VTGNEPHLTGEYPCSVCGGAGDYDDVHDCWMCGGSGVHPEDAPRCPKCGGDTEWFGDMPAEAREAVRDATEYVANYDEYNVVVCHDCGEVSR